MSGPHLSALFPVWKGSCSYVPQQAVGRGWREEERALPEPGVAHVLRWRPAATGPLRQPSASARYSW